MFPLKHVTSAWLTAENNLSLQASGWLTQTFILLLFPPSGGARPWTDCAGTGGTGAKDKEMKFCKLNFEEN